MRWVAALATFAVIAVAVQAPATSGPDDCGAACAVAALGGTEPCCDDCASAGSCAAHACCRCGHSHVCALAASFAFAVPGPSVREIAPWVGAAADGERDGHALRSMRPPRG